MRSSYPFKTAALLLLMSGLGLAQFNSNVQGVVEDSSGAAVPNAKVELRNLETNVADQANTNTEGYYRFNSLAVGRYKITISAEGFRPGIVEVALTTGQSRDVNFTLSLAASQQSVEVTGEAPPLDTTETRIQMSIGQEKLRDLPMFGNNLISIMTVAPGVVGSVPASSDNFENEYFPEMSANGRSFVGNQFNMDGLSVTSNITSGTLNVAPNPDAIDELTVETNTFKVDQGLSSSLVVNMVTKSGTNQFHGSGKYLFTNQDLRARTVFTTSPYDPFRKHNITGTFGGPIVKNKTFFFAAVESLRSQASSGSSLTTFESPEFVNWAKEKFPDSLGTKILTTYPVKHATVNGVANTAADVFGASCNTADTYFIPCGMPVVDSGTYTSNPFRNGLQYTFRGDQYLRDGKDRLYGSYTKMNRDDQNIAVRQGFESTNNASTWAVQGNWTHSFAPTILNELSFGGNRVDGLSTKEAPFQIPTISVSGQDTGVDPGWSGTYVQHNYNMRDVVSWVRGTHSLRVGGGYYWGDDYADFSNAQGRPNFYFLNLIDLVTDKPYSEGGVAYDPLTGQAKRFLFGSKINTVNLFVQDEWRVKPNLMLTLGFRWDDFGNPIGIKGFTFSNVYFGTGTLDQQVTNAVVKSAERPFAHRLNRNFAPRFGFAWSPRKGGKTSIRGGIGLYHDAVLLGETIDLLRGNPPGYLFPSFSQVTDIKPIFSVGNSAQWPYGYTLPTIPVSSLNAAGGLVGVKSAVGGIDPNLSTPRTMNWAIGIERETVGKMVVGVNYTGSRTWNALGGTDYNRFAGDLVDGKLDQLNPNFGSISYVSNVNKMWYQSMLVTARRMVGSRYSFQASYNLGKATDFGQGGDRTTYYDSFDDQHHMDDRKGPSAWDIRHRFSISGTVMLPEPPAAYRIAKAVLGGWELGIVGTAQTGNPFNVVNTDAFAMDASGKNVGGDYNADGYGYDFPNAPTTDYSASHSRQQFLNGLFTAADFPVPAVGARGTLKRHAYRNPGYFGINSSVIKNCKVPKLGERTTLQLRFEFFNVLNRVNLGAVDGSLTSSTFGMVTSAMDPRVIQLGARLQF